MKSRKSVAAKSKARSAPVAYVGNSVWKLSASDIEALTHPGDFYLIIKINLLKTYFIKTTQYLL